MEPLPKKPRLEEPMEEKEENLLSFLDDREVQLKGAITEGY